MWSFSQNPSDSKYELCALQLNYKMCSSLKAVSQKLTGESGIYLTHEQEKVYWNIVNIHNRCPSIATWSEVLLEMIACWCLIGHLHHKKVSKVRHLLIQESLGM